MLLGVHTHNTNAQVIMIEDDDLKAIEGRCAAATAGPWKSFLEGRDNFSGSSFIRTPIADIYLFGATDADQEFIAHAREDVLKLLAEVRRLKSA